MNAFLFLADFEGSSVEQPLPRAGVDANAPFAPTSKMTRSRLNQMYVWLVTAAGASVVVFSAAHLTRGQIDVRFLLLALVTVLIGSRLSIQIQIGRASCR